MPYTPAALKTQVDALAAAGVRIALHSADPGTTGANELAIGRQATTWGNAEASTYNGRTSQRRVGSRVTFNITAPATISHWSLWSAATGGVLLYAAALGAQADTYGSNGTYDVDPTIHTVDIV